MFTVLEGKRFDCAVFLKEESVVEKLEVVEES